MADEENPTGTLEESPSEAEQVEPVPQDMEIDYDDDPPHEEEPEEHVENVPEDVEKPSEEAVEKSRIQKESFLEMFKIAPKIKDILPDLRVFMSDPDVIDWDRKEVQMLVEIRIQEEKAKKKAEKASKKQEEAVEKPPVALADAIRATGIDLAGILQKVPHLQQQASSSSSSTPPPSGGPIVFPPGHPLGPPLPPKPPVHLPQSIPIESLPPGAPLPCAPLRIAGFSDADVAITTSSHPQLPPHIPVIRIGIPTIKSIGRGKMGFNTPHPNDVPPELRHAKPDLVAPIPDELRVPLGRPEKKIAAIPNEFLPPEQRVYDELPIIFLRPPMRKTLFLAGARFGKRSDRMKGDEKKGGKKKNNKRNEDDLPAKRARMSFASGINALPAGLNKNSPLAVKRYHARQLAKDTGMSLEEAMNEIEEQCNEFGGEDTELAREHDEKAMEMIKKKGDELWNQRYNYTPADHSKGIPGVDRPPAGLPPKKDREPVPGIDRPPGGGGRREDREPIPGVDRPPGAGRRERIPGIDGPPGGGFGGGEERKKRNRGGVKEREKRRRREAFEMRQSRGGFRGVGRGYDAYNERNYGRPYDYDRNMYDDFGGAHRAPYSAADHSGYDDGGYDDYYGRQDTGRGGYDDYSHHYAEGGYGGGDRGGYDGYGAAEAAAATDNYYNQGHSQDGHGSSTYYQEDGDQYYNQYYSSTAEAGPSEAPPAPSETVPPPPPVSEYHAKFGAPSSTTTSRPT